MKILVVDDDVISRSLIVAFLERCNETDVIDVCNAKCALKAFNKIDFDVLITDIEMPNMSGEELKNEVRKVNSKIPIVAHTSLDGKEYKCSDFNFTVTKPVDFFTFQMIVEALKIDVNLNKGGG